jgi:hypothetical protein
MLTQTLITEISEQTFSDKARLKKHLETAEKELAEVYTLILKMQESGQIKDERLITNTADSWHYAIESLRILED